MNTRIPHSRHASHGSDPLRQMQADWDNLNRRVGRRASHRLLRPVPAARAALRRHRWQVFLHWLLVLCGLLAVVLSWATLWRYTAYCPQATVAALLLLAVSLLATGASLRAAILVSSWRQPSLPRHHLLRTATATLTLLLVFPCVSHGTLGDDLVISQSFASPLDHTLRAESIQTVNNIFDAYEEQ